MSPTMEEFQTWKDSPVTQWVTKALALASQKNKDSWIKESWEGKNPDPMLLCELSTRADAYSAIAETAYERWCEFNGDDPRTD